jgi:hypothetical protein
MRRILRRLKIQNWGRGGGEKEEGDGDKYL